MNMNNKNMNTKGLDLIHIKHASVSHRLTSDLLIRVFRRVSTVSHTFNGETCFGVDR